jgi:hypothetical protein
VHVDREQFKRVVVNLVDNAAEAMQDSLVKRLYIGTRSTEADSVELIVADTGCGVSARTRKAVPAVFFDQGAGNGPGPGDRERILADHDATIRVEDNVPPARVSSWIFPSEPSTRCEARPKRTRMPRRGDPFVKPAHILIVDDEPLIRQSLAGVLEDEGYQTHAVATGEECLPRSRATLTI